MGVLGIENDLSKRGMMLAASSALGQIAIGLGNRKPGQSESEALAGALGMGAQSFGEGILNAKTMGDQEAFNVWADKRMASGDVGPDELEVLRAARSGNKAYALLVPSLLRARTADRKSGTTSLTDSQISRNREIDNWRAKFKRDGITPLEAQLMQQPTSTIYKSMKPKEGVADADYESYSRWVNRNVQLLGKDENGNPTVTEPIAWPKWDKNWSHRYGYQEPSEADPDMPPQEQDETGFFDSLGNWVIGMSGGSSDPVTASSIEDRILGKYNGDEIQTVSEGPISSEADPNRQTTIRPSGPRVRSLQSQDLAPNPDLYSTDPSLANQSFEPPVEDLSGPQPSLRGHRMITSEPDRQMGNPYQGIISGGSGGEGGDYGLPALPGDSGIMSPQSPPMSLYDSGVMNRSTQKDLRRQTAQEINRVYNGRRSRYGPSATTEWYGKAKEFIGDAYDLTFPGYKRTR